MLLLNDSTSLLSNEQLCAWCEPDGWSRGPADVLAMAFLSTRSVAQNSSNAEQNCSTALPSEMWVMNNNTP
jgi:hypothetical protein